MDIDHRANTLRIFGRNGKIAGTGILIGKHHVLTCAHVIAIAQAQALDCRRPLDEPIEMDFPLLAEAPMVLALPLSKGWRPVSETVRTGEVSDIAVLVLSGTVPLPDAAHPARFIDLPGFMGREVMAFGFPRADGDYASGLRLLDLNARGIVQIEQRPGYPGVDHGFSGAAVWDRKARAVVGMLVRKDTRDTTPTAYMIPTATLRLAWPELPATTKMNGPTRALHEATLVFLQCLADGDPDRNSGTRSSVPPWCDP